MCEICTAKTQKSIGKKGGILLRWHKPDSCAAAHLLTISGQPCACSTSRMWTGLWNQGASRVCVKNQTSGRCLPHKIWERESYVCVMNGKALAPTHPHFTASLCERGWTNTRQAQRTDRHTIRVEADGASGQLLLGFIQSASGTTSQCIWLTHTRRLRRSVTTRSRRFSPCCQALASQIADETDVIPCSQAKGLGLFWCHMLHTEIARTCLVPRRAGHPSGSGGWARVHRQLLQSACACLRLGNDPHKLCERAFGAGKHTGTSTASGSHRVSIVPPAWPLVVGTDKRSCRRRCTEVPSAALASYLRAREGLRQG